MNSTVAKLLDNVRDHHGKINRTRLKYVEKHVQGTVLDIGCARGGYVKYFKDLGFEINGIDLISFEKDWRELGINEYCKKIEPNEEIGEMYDTVFLFEVLEHIPNPTEYLKWIKSSVGKKIIITVPNCEPNNILSAGGLAFNHYTDSSHVNFFDKHSLTKTLTEAGFEIDYYDQFNYVNAFYIVFRQIGLSEKISKLLAKINFFAPNKIKYTQIIIAHVKS